MEKFGKEIDEKRRDDLIKNMCGGVVKSHAAKDCHKKREERSCHKTNDDATDKEDGKGLRGSECRKCTGYCSGNGKLKGYDTGSVIDKRFARKKGSLTVGKMYRRAKCGNGGGIGRTERCGKGKRRR